MTSWHAAACVFVICVCFAAGCGGSRGGPDALLDELERAKQPGYVFDFARVINSADRAAIEQTLRRVEAQTTAEVKVVTLPSLQGGEINDFANRLFERWGIGKKYKDNGVLLLAAIEDRKVRIEAGYGIEPVLPDAAAGRLLDSVVLPAFRRDDYSGGLRAGAEAIAARLGGERESAAPMPTAQSSAPPAGPFEHIFRVIIFIIVLIFVIRHPFLALMLLGGGGGGGSRGGGFGGGGFGGGFSGGGGASRGW